MGKLIENFFVKIERHEIFVMASALAYATALALAPFILIILSLISVLDFDLQKRFSIELTTSFGGEVGTAVEAILENVDKHPQLSGLSGFIGFVVLFFSASMIFTQLRIALDKINEYKSLNTQFGFTDFIRSKFWALGLVLGFAFLSIVSLLVTALIAFIYPESESLLLHSFSFLVNFLLFTLLFTAIYRFIPTEKLEWSRCFYSGLISTTFYLIGKSLISLYLAKAGLGSPYGAAGSLIVFLAWVYFTSLTLLISYELSTNVILSRFKKLEF